MSSTPHVAEQAVTFAPDVFIVPGKVMLDPALQPLDSKVYGIIYWLERLKDGRCWASNETIAKIIGASGSAVSHSISRLAEQRYVIVSMNNRNQRTGITCTQSFASSGNPSSNEQGGVAQTSYRGNNIKEEKYTSEMLTEIETCYKIWLIYMVVDPQTRSYSTEDEKRAALVLAKKHTKLTDKRKAALARRIDDAGAARVKRAIINLSKSDFHRNGSEDSKWKADIEWLCKSYEKVEEWSNK